jgi:hypothetical protein
MVKRMPTTADQLPPGGNVLQSPRSSKEAYLHIGAPWPGVPRCARTWCSTPCHPWTMTEPTDGRAVAETIAGLYEQVLTRRLARLEEQLHDLAHTSALLRAEAPQYLTNHVARAIARALQAPGVGSDLLRQVQLCNDLLDLVARQVPDAVAHADDRSLAQRCSWPFSNSHRR